MLRMCHVSFKCCIFIYSILHSPVVHDTLLQYLIVIFHYMKTTFLINCENDNPHSGENKIYIMKNIIDHNFVFLQKHLQRLVLHLEDDLKIGGIGNESSQLFTLQSKKSHQYLLLIGKSTSWILRKIIWHRA